MRIIYAVFANLAKVMKEEFAPALPELVPHLVQVIGTDEGQLEPAEDAEKVCCACRSEIFFTHVSLMLIAGIAISSFHIPADWRVQCFG